MASVDWYFDFISPFAYLQREQLHTLGPGVRVRYRPVLFAGLLEAHGHKGPAEIGRKREFSYRYLVWHARRMQIPFKMPPEHPFNPLRLLRLAVACDCTPESVQRIFRFVWADGRLPDLPIEWAELVSALGVPDAETRIAAPEVKAELRRNTDEAIERGVFGVPTLMVGDELFWGADATAMAADYIAAGSRWTDPEYARVSALPQGAVRDVPTAKPGSKRKPARKPGAVRAAPRRGTLARAE